MRNQLKTPEFWAAFIGQLIGIVVLFGGLTETQAVDLHASLEAIIGGAISILTTLGYINAQGVRKELVTQLVIAKLNATNNNEVAGIQSVNNTKDIDDLINQI